MVQPGARRISRTIPEVFGEQVRLYADKPAVVMGGTCLDYRSLDTRSTQLAHMLCRQGVTTSQRVALCAERSIEWVIASLGILKAGAAYVPVDPAYPPEQLQFMVGDADVSAIVVQRHLRSHLPPCTVPIIELDPEFGPLDGIPAAPCVVSVGSADAAYVMFTSGSTGKPKGVVVTHGGVVHLVRDQTYVPFGPDLRILCISSPAFDAITFEVWGALLNGATCVISAQDSVDLDSMEQTLRDYRVTTCILTTSLFNRVIDLKPLVLAPMRHVIVGGEAASPVHLRRALQALPHVTFVNGYGPTECTTFSCTYAVPSSGQWPAESVPIGFPLRHTHCVVLNDQMEAVPCGDAGELYIGGEGVASGYFKRPELTAERFVTLSVGGSPLQRFYRSGDMCRQLSSGEIIYVGRRDAQVKLRGHRIEMGEVEAVLREYAGLQEAAVALEFGSSGSPQLIAYLVMSPIGRLTHDRDLRLWVAARLPAHMCPAQYRVVKTLPLTANGKLDRAALASLHAESLTRAVEYRAPDSALEKLLASIWGEALRMNPLGVDNDFFASGGDSLLALQVVLDMERSLNRKLSIGAVYEAPTVARMAQHLGNDGSAIGQPTLCGSGAGAPLFYIPGARGFTFMPQAIRRRLEGICTYCDSLHFPGSLPTETPFETFEEIAAGLAKQIHDGGPVERCNLMGYSIGGELAVEVTRQLRVMGVDVERIFLIDSMRSQASKGPGLLEEIGTVCLLLLRGDRPQARDRIREHGTKLLRRAGNVLRRCGSSIRMAHLPPTGQTELLGPEDSQVSMSRVQEGLFRARNTYRWYPADTRAIYLRSKALPPALHAGWEGLFARGLTVHEFDCNHPQMIMEPIISQVADVVIEELRNGGNQCSP